MWAGKLNMVKITSTKADGAKVQIVTELDRPSSGTGYSNMDGKPTLSFRLSASAEREIGRFGNRKARLSDRNVHLRLETEDLITLVNRLVNPNYSSGYHFYGKATGPDDALCNSVMEACGLHAEEYRYPVDHYSCRDGWLYIWAFNERHALHQLNRFNFVKGTVDPVNLQRRANDGSGWLEE
jgi:hypothetical protein